MASTTFSGRTGDTSSTSIVPVSFSRTIDTEVIMAQIRMKIMPMMPGTKLYELFICRLNSRRVPAADTPGAPDSRTLVR